MVAHEARFYIFWLNIAIAIYVCWYIYLRRSKTPPNLRTLIGTNSSRYVNLWICSRDGCLFANVQFKFAVLWLMLNNQWYLHVSRVQWNLFVLKYIVLTAETPQSGWAERCKKQTQCRQTNVTVYNDWRDVMWLYAMRALAPTFRNETEILVKPYKLL